MSILTWEQGDLLAIAIARGDTIHEAAAFAGCHNRTVSRRLKDPAFIRDVRKRRAEITSEAAGKAAKMASEALLRLEEIALDPDVSPAVRRQANKDILDIAFKTHYAEGSDSSTAMDDWTLQELEAAEERLGITYVPPTLGEDEPE